METIINFFSTPEGIALSSIVTISSLIYAVFQKSKIISISNEIITKNKTITSLKSQNIEITQKLTAMSNSNNEFKIINSKLTETVNNLENGDISHNKKSVNQTGKNNISSGNIDGDVTLKLS
jgi:hypothetical protein